MGSRLMPWKMPRDEYDPIMLRIGSISVCRLRPDYTFTESGIAVYAGPRYYRLQITPSFVIIPDTSSGGIISNAG